ncbi:MAG: nicotinamide-nucleotide adenylyltransferase [Thermoplasmata archaeon]
MRGLFIGRFQPFHNGHLTIVKQMQEECDVIAIGVGSAQEQRTQNNPLSGGERITMIRRLLESEGILNFEIYPIPDLNCYPAWPHYVCAILPRFHRVYANSGVVKRLFKNIGVEVVEAEPVNREIWKGSVIRKKIAQGDKWKYLVPVSVAEYLEDIDMKEKVKPILECIAGREKKVAHLLTKNEMTISVAESCTGGLIAHRLTGMPGASAYFVSGVVSYSNDSKMKLLDVEPEILRKYGAVSEQVAKQMAENIRKKIDSHIGISATGIAGPGGGSEEKKVGMVYMGLAMENMTEIKKFNFRGNRRQVIQQTSDFIFNWLVEILED